MRRNNILDHIRERTPDPRWLIFESATVVDNDDPDGQHRVMVVIPSVDPDNAWPDWVRAAPLCMGDGWGQVMIPPRGSEVLITGALGEKHNLYYLGAAYNEEMSIPDELGVDTPGIKVDKNLSFIAGLLLGLQAQNIRVDAEELTHVSGQNAEVIASQTLHLQGETVNINGTTLSINADGLVTIHGATAINISSDGNVMIENRLVRKLGPPI